MEITYERLVRYERISNKPVTTRTEDERNYVRNFENALEEVDLQEEIWDIYDGHWSEETIDLLKERANHFLRVADETKMIEQPVSIDGDTAGTWMQKNAQIYHRAQGAIHELRSLRPIIDRHKHIISVLHMLAGSIKDTRFQAIIALALDAHPVVRAIDELDEYQELFEARVKQATFNKEVMSSRMTLEVSLMGQWKGVSKNQ